jgi:hypothetical protein
MVCEESNSLECPNCHELTGKTNEDFECSCGRKQSYAPPDKRGGITVEEAIAVGWTFDDNFHCPFCSGNEDKLQAVFMGTPPPSTN